jgi:hypothetical protein
MTCHKSIVFRCLGLLLLTAARLHSADIWNTGLLFDQFPLTLDIGQRTEAVGPLFYRQQKDTELTFAVPPLFSHVSDAVTDSEEFDFAYPLLTYDRFGKEYRWQFFQLLSLSGGQNQNEIPKTRFTLFPFYFQQRSPDSNQNYTAMIPVYGHLKNRLFRDEIFLVAFPLYVQSRKRDVVTDNYLYPIFHLRHGDSLSGWQFWPLVGSEHKGITTRTNGFGGTETIGGHEKFFALWPFYFNQTAGIGTDNTEKSLGVLPIFSTLRSPKRDSTAVLWPFFNVVDDRERKYHEWQTPWPLIVFARGEGKTTSRVWPLFSRAHNQALEDDFYLWPLYKYKHLRAGALDRERTRILFFLYSDVTEKNTETQAARRRVDFWPLFTSHRDFNGGSRLQILAPLEPILPNNKSIERNYSPLWSLWRSEKNPATGDTSQSLLWNLYRREAAGPDKKCSLLFGLFQYQSIAGGKRLNLFFVPVVNTGSRTNDDVTTPPASR